MMLSIPRLSAALAIAAVCALALAASASASWTVAPGTVLPNPGLTSGISCPTTAGCLLVGQQAGSTSTGLAADWTASTSTFTQIATASTTAAPVRVSCPSTTWCMDVGYDDSGTVTVPHAESFSTVVTDTSMVAPPSSVYAKAIGVSCVSSSDCWAVGFGRTATQDSGFIEHWNGTAWSNVSFTPPSGTLASSLSDVSCPSSTYCVAVGWYERNGQPRQTLAEVWNGTAWTAQTTANPVNFSGSQLLGVSCDSSTRCMAVGDYQDNSFVRHSLAESSNGSTWTLRSVADPSGQTDPRLNEVACSTSPAYACEGVGDAVTATGHGAPIAAGWNGTAWSLQSVAVPSSTTDNMLYGVSCSNNSTCVAVGASLYSTLSGIRPWVELGP
jgi:hypothetical protein